MLERGHVKLSAGPEKLHQVQRSQVARRVVEEHVFRAGIRGIDARRVARSVPAVDGRVVLHAWIAAVPRGIRDLVQQVARAHLFRGLAVCHVARPPVAVFFRRAHEVVRHAHGVVRVLEENRSVGVAVDSGVVTLFDEDLRLALFLHLAFDEFDDIRMIDIENDHLGRAPRLAAALDHACEGVEALHKAHRAGGDAAA